MKFDLIFLISFSMGIFPSVLKTAKIIPVHKKGSKFDCNNYRPISLLPNIENFFEKLVYIYNRITKFLNNNNPIYPLQFSLQNNYSTNHALINLTEDIRKNQMKEKLGVVFLQTSKKPLILLIITFYQLNQSIMEYKALQMIG